MTSYLKLQSNREVSIQMTQGRSTNESKHVTKNPILRFALQRFFNSVNRILPDVNSIIDAGCGEGYGARGLRTGREYLDIYGFDLSISALRKSLAIESSISVSQADVTRLPVPNDCVDLVMSLEVLEHIPEPDRAIEEYKRVTRRYLLLSVPNEPLFRMLRMLRGDNIRQWGNHPEHVNHWNYFSFQRFIKSHQLQVIRATCPPPFIWTIALCEIKS